MGPQSAGSSPGPACYGEGGPLCLTDVNLLLGRITPEQFGIPVDLKAAQNRLAEIQKRIAELSGEEIGSQELLNGFLEMANERMADAIRCVSLRKGYEPKDHCLVAFGGAGPQHACGVGGSPRGRRMRWLP